MKYLVFEKGKGMKGYKGWFISENVVTAIKHVNDKKLRIESVVPSMIAFDIKNKMTPENWADIKFNSTTLAHSKNMLNFIDNL